MRDAAKPTQQHQKQQHQEQQHQEQQHPAKPLFPLVFIGPMAAGKTRIGRLVARTLDVPFVDTDARIVADHGAIKEIFEQHGEEHFRALEREVVAQALTEKAVVSLGGGAVLDPDTQADLARCSVVYLSVSAQAVRRRLGGGKRPLLRGGIADWKRIYNQRRPTYEALASIRFDTSHRPLDAIADAVVTWTTTRT
ncbi:shikimate kinase [Cryobacterium sp. TMT1-21]|uniref:Shikimate kinase n=1 Tax=Cryobacterium shii TaxID=1259235 RepID=A0AAQ2HGK5_9MICO|nr:MULTISPECIES: shikimate kinase [Cryobacterium]TFC51666.1 shikimate kinase [Cryobacterium shii]TFD13633.1 shikimate kinase [Cryobacterium sp. TMT4-10]TFD16004.1 shikimate kinase [Cryobacterium sp. TMT1-21]TFD38269.1 shikimate kinase [Cryobacterium sp. TMT2-10]